jgi:hypothetical protein
MEESLLQQKFVPVFSKGKVFYNEFATRRPDGTTTPTPTFVMSFDAIVADAECRNHTFLEILKNGIKQQTEKWSLHLPKKATPIATHQPTKIHPISK